MHRSTYRATLLGCFFSLLCTGGLTQDLPPAPHEAEFPTAFLEPYKLTFIVDDLPQINPRQFGYSFFNIQTILRDETPPMQTRYERALLKYNSVLTEHATYLSSKPSTFQAYWLGSLEHYFTDALASTGIGYEGDLPTAMVERIRAARPLLVEISTAENYWTQMLYYTRDA